MNASVLRGRCAALAFTFLAACATTPLEESRKLIAQGFTEQGLARLEEAAREKPRDPEIRTALMREREMAGIRLIQLAAAARSQGRLDEAEEAYARVLRISPDNQRAQAGLAAIAADRRHPQLLREAEGLVAKNEFAEAEAKVRAILTENVNHTEARTLLRKITEAASVRATAAPVLGAAANKEIDLEFRDATLRQVFDTVSRAAGINFAFDKDVRADTKVTIVMRKARVADVIRLILATNQLERKVLNENTLLVYPNTPAKAREYQELMVRSFYVTNTEVAKTLAMIKAVVKTRDTFIDEKLNLLVIRDTPEAVRLAERLIAAQDMADPEVILEVEVLEVGSSLLQTIGPQFPTSIFYQDPAALAANATAQRISAPFRAFVATPELILNLKQQDGLTNVLANPRIRVKNREKAKIHIGDKVPVVTTTATANVGIASSVSYLDVGLKLDVEPSIRIENDVEIKVSLEVSNIVKEVPVQNGGLAYQIGTRNASTVLRLHDGETQVLAGLIQDDDRSTASKLPGFGDLPLLGRLFSSNNVTRTKTEVVLLITPRIARNLTRPEYAVSEFLSGTDLAAGAPPFFARPVRPGGLALSMVLGNTPASRLAPVAAAAQGPIPITLGGPPQVKVGSEVAVDVTIGSNPRLVDAQVILGFDPAILAPVASSGQLLEPGRLQVSVSAAPGGADTAVQVKFQLLAKSPGASQVSVLSATLRDSDGGALPGSESQPLTVTFVP